MGISILDTSFSGTYAPYLIKRAMYGMDTLKKGICYVESGIKKLHTIDRLDLENPLSPRQETPTDDGQNPFVIDGRTLIPQDVQAYRVINPRDFEVSQLGLQLADAILARQIPVELATQLFTVLLGRSAEQLENGIWVGSTAYQGHYTSSDERYQVQYFNGFIQQMVNDPLINLSTISPVAITTSNILTILDDLVSEASRLVKALITDERTFQDMKFLMSAKTYNIYGQALRTGTTFKGNSLDASSAGRWGGYEVVRIAGMPDNTVLFCRATDDAERSNLWVGMNSQKDWDLRVDQVTNNSESYFMLAKWKWCVNYGWPQEIFMYTTLTEASFEPSEGGA